MSETSYRIHSLYCGVGKGIIEKRDKLLIDTNGVKDDYHQDKNIILLDLMIPTITGIEVLRTLRDPAKTPKLHAQIIVATNLEQREEVKADIEAQADGYLIKAEITPHQLVDFLNRLQ